MPGSPENTGFTGIQEFSETQKKHLPVSPFGNQGNFDRLVRSVLKEVTTAYPEVGYAVVLAYMPSAKATGVPEDFSDTILPEGIEKVLKRYTIPWRNKWMIEHADFVVTYVLKPSGGASKFSLLSKKRGKKIYPLI